MRFHRLVFVGLILLPLAGARAQTGVVPPRRVGITAGVNWSTFSSEGSDDLSRRTGFVGGVTMVIPTSPTLSIQPELLYTMKGAKMSALGVTQTAKLDYLEIPVLLRYDVPAVTRARPFVNGGLATAFKISCTFDATGGGLSGSADCDDPAIQGDELETFDFSVVLGGGIAFDVGGRVASIGVRYTRGLMSIGDDGSVRNRVLSVLASFEFPWRK